MNTDPFAILAQPNGNFQSERHRFSLRAAGIRLLLLLSLVGAAQITVSFRIADNIAEFNRQAEHATDAVDRAHLLQYHISQIQQYLTDISATGDEDGFDDAKRHAEESRRLLNEILLLLPQSNAAVNEIREKLERFYDVGIEMARVYLAEGKVAGNRAMKQPDTGFDARSNTLIESLDILSRPLERQADSAKNQLNIEVSQMRRWSTALNLLSLLAVIGLCLQGFRQLWNCLGGEPEVVAELANGIATGDLNQSVKLRANDNSSVMAAMLHMSNTIKALLAAMDHMSSEHQKGDIDVMVDTTRFKGGFKTMAQGVNEMVSAHIAVKKQAMACIQLFGEGNLDAPLERFPGKKAFINDTVEQLRGNLKQIVGEIRDIVSAANRGDFSVKMDLTGKAGFTKELSELLNQLSGTVDIAFKDTIDVAEAMEQGNLTKTVTRQYQGAYDQVKQSLNNTVAKLSQTITDVVSAADQLSSASEQIQSTSQSLSQASSEQAASVEETSASIEEMATSIGQNAENAKVTDGMATKASQEAVEGGAAVKQTVEAMKSIAGKIGIIDDIAYQTNMLALNAAIEAARAGDHGKGFAVVAAEVRKLAERSQIAAQEIGQLAETSVSTAESAGRLLDAIVPSIAKTSALVQAIAAASQEQSAGVSQVNTAMNQMNQITQQNAAASEELASTAEEMTGQAEQLQSLMSFFKIASSGGQRRAGTSHGGHAPHAKPTAAKRGAAPSRRHDATGLAPELPYFERF
ncbi:methyl-accepting chemotaxis protein [Methylomonas koyamae]|uniref:Methyl-accepting chemotaxis protein n=1 Tax=Methylomonas koyamae TaxID=702114 RepID=A0A177PCY7_9GAMM|nr:methyl-accepting chemotaxis protein [Methylomonas koyamae]OAI27323.1 hypothetical protein A1355_18205 [Methylomonas koyamae]